MSRSKGDNGVACVFVKTCEHGMGQHDINALVLLHNPIAIPPRVNQRHELKEVNDRRSYPIIRHNSQRLKLSSNIPQPLLSTDAVARNPLDLQPSIAYLQSGQGATPHDGQKSSKATENQPLLQEHYGMLIYGLRTSSERIYVRIASNSAFSLELGASLVVQDRFLVLAD